VGLEEVGFEFGVSDVGWFVQRGFFVLSVWVLSTPTSVALAVVEIE